MEDKTSPDLVNQILTSVPPVKEHHTSPFLISIALLFFSPVAFFLIYRDSYYHRWIIHLLYAGALLPVAVYLAQVLFVVPQLEVLTQSLKTPMPSVNTGLYSSVLIGLAFFQILLGIYFSRKIKPGQTGYKPLLIPAFIFMTVNFTVSSWILGVFLTSLLEPLYHLT